MYSFGNGDIDEFDRIFIYSIDRKGNEILK